MGVLGGLAVVGSVCFQTFKSLRFSVLATSRGGTGGVRKDNVSGSNFETAVSLNKDICMPLLSSRCLSDMEIHRQTVMLDMLTHTHAAAGMAAVKVQNGTCVTRHGRRQQCILF